ncbi:MAG: M1 family aminopeptidase [Phycisphaerae bacterium]|nr:M1 family aminopeptidase [Phycisphaerae bacterium]
MSIYRIASLAWSDIRFAWRRPIYIALFLILSLMTLGLVLGGVQITAGSTDTGGAKAWINSEFNLAFVDIILLALILPFFAAVGSGMSVLTDEDRKLDRMLHATPLTFMEYATARFLGAVVPIAGVLLAWMIVQIGLYEFWPLDNADEVRGPFALMNYVWPMLIFGGTLLVTFAGTAMLLGTLTRQPALVFALPTIMLVGGVFFLWSFSPEWLPQSVNRAMQLVDPAGMRWMMETYRTVDRGVGYYNTTPVGIEIPFALSRIVYLAIGLACIPCVAAIVRRRVRGSSPVVALDAIPQHEAITVLASVAASGPLPECTQRVPGLLGTTAVMLRSELRSLVRSPGLWIFGPLILLQVLGTALIRTGPLDTLVLSTSGSIAAGAFNTLTLLLTLLILYYTVESLVREERHNVAKIIRSTAAPTAGMLAGKILANAAMTATIVGAAFIAALIALLWQLIGSKVPIAPELGVFAFIWVVLLAPTLIVWSSFVTLVYAAIRSRYATYAVALGALVLTGFLTQFGYMNWASRWHLWSSVRWSDLDRLDVAWTSIVWNRILMLAIAVFFITLTLRIWPRRLPDIRAQADRMQPAKLLRSMWAPALAALPAVVIACGMLIAMRAGSQGGPQERKAKDYWRQNSATWENAPSPALDSVTADVELFPESHSFHVKGTYVLRNAGITPIMALPLTLREHLTVSQWTVDGVSITPGKVTDDTDPPAIDDQAGLMVVRPVQPLAPGERVTVGFELVGVLPRGWSKRSAGAGEFVLPSGVVLTTFSGSFMPLVGFSSGVGEDDDNRRDAKDYPDSHFEHDVDPLFGPAWSTSVTMKVTAPESWTVNAVGVPGEPMVADGKKTITWTTDHPVRFFNLVGGPLVEKKGTSTSVYYDARHSYNIDRVSETLDHARAKYSEWFYPYPWRDLKLTEFPGLADYAQGFPGNISFSESIGFLTKRGGDDEADAVEFVVAHEAAHQWWGNILTPGKGPGGNVLSEGMANFSAALLIEDLRGNAARKSLMRRFEAQYSNGRSPDSERPLHKIDGTRPGDTTVTYDRGGWAFWMLKDAMGREPMLGALRAFIERFKDGPDFPLVEDMIATLREQAEDPEGFDAFVNQWIFGKVVPEFKLSEITVNRNGSEWTVTGTVTNVGTGTIEIDIGAFGALGAKPESDDAATAVEPTSTTRVVTEPNQAAAFTIVCPFEPARVDVDPDVRVLQLNRKAASKEVAVK